VLAKNRVHFKTVAATFKDPHFEEKALWLMSNDPRLFEHVPT
jgi:hypothetical protein